MPLLGRRHCGPASVVNTQVVSVSGLLQPVAAQFVNLMVKVRLWREIEIVVLRHRRLLASEGLQGPSRFGTILLRHEVWAERLLGLTLAEGQLLELAFPFVGLPTR